MGGRQYGRTSSRCACPSDFRNGKVLLTQAAGSFEHEANLEHQVWPTVSSQSQTSSHFQQHGTHLALSPGPYWMQSEEVGTPPYRQQPYSIITTPIPGQYPHDVQPVYQSPLYQDTRQSAARQSFSGLSTTHVDQPFHNHNFSEMERRMTMPANIYNHAEDTPTNMQMERQLTQAQSPYGYNQQFPLQYAQSPQSGNWFSPPTPQQGFHQQHQSSPHDSTPIFPPNPG